MLRFYARAYTPKFVQLAVTRHRHGRFCVLHLWGARFSKPRALHGKYACAAHGGHVFDVTVLHGPWVTGDSNLYKLRYNARAYKAQHAEPSVTAQNRP